MIDICTQSFSTAPFYMHRGTYGNGQQEMHASQAGKKPSLPDCTSLVLGKGSGSHGSPFPHGRVKDFFADTQGFWRYL